MLLHVDEHVDVEEFAMKMLNKCPSQLLCSGGSGFLRTVAMIKQFLVCVSLQPENAHTEQFGVE